MKQPPRGPGIPEAATWDSKEDIWQLGEYKGQGKKRAPVGEWRYWSDAGQLVCIANFDDQGRQHGLVERFHPDGSLASRGEWKSGNRHGHFMFIRGSGDSSESYPGGYDTWRFEFDSFTNWDEKNVHWYLEDGTECTADGRPLDIAYDLDDVISSANPQSFLDHDANVVSVRFDQSDELKELLRDPFELEELWGSSNNQIDRLIAYVVEGDQFTKSDSRRKFEANSWEALIAHKWGNRYEELGALFMGAVQIGYLGDSDSVYATVFGDENGKHQPGAVFLWSHDTYCIDEILSLDLDSFAYRVAVSQAYYAQRLSPGATKKAWMKLADKVCVGWECSSGLSLLTEREDDTEAGDSEELVDQERFKIELDPSNEIRGAYWRAAWIIHLLDSDKERNWDYVRENFSPGWNRQYDEALFKKKLELGKDAPQLAIYLLWRFFFFDQQERLKTCLNQYRQHRAALVRELVDLIERIEGGSLKSIGGIDDILDVRRRFLELDLSPERESERRIEASEAAHREADRLANVLEEALSDAKQGANEIIDRAWASVQDAGAMKEIEKAARTIADHELEWRAFDWVRGRGFDRAGQSLGNEAKEVGAWLGTRDTRLIQPFIYSGMYTACGESTALLLEGLGRTKGALDQRLIAACLSTLDCVEEYHHKRELAVKVLGWMEALSTTSRLCDLIDEYLKVVASLSGYDAALAAIPYDELLLTIGRTLNKFAIVYSGGNSEGKAGVDRARVVRSLRQLLERSLRDYRWDIAAACLDALVSWGDRNVLPYVSALLRANDSPAFASALRAIEVVAAHMDVEERKSFTILEFRNPSDHTNETTLLFHRAAIALNRVEPELVEAVSISEALTEARELSNYGDGWKEWRITECQTIGAFEELDLDSIAHYLKSTDYGLRQAAEKAFQKRGVKPPSTRTLSWVDVWSATDNKGKGEAAHALCELLNNPTVVDRSAISAWLWENPSELSAGVIAQLVQHELQHFTPPESGEHLSSDLEWLLRALARHAAFPPALETIERCLEFQDDAVSGAVISEVDSLPLSCSKQLVAIAREDSGWRRHLIDQWTAKHSIKKR